MRLPVESGALRDETDPQAEPTNLANNPELDWWQWNKAKRNASIRSKLLNDLEFNHSTRTIQRRSLITANLLAPFHRQDSSSPVLLSLIVSLPHTAK